jgi:mycofactocin precursor
MEDTAVVTVGDGPLDDELDDYTDEELLVEEISIDGMCGVY